MIKGDYRILYLKVGEDYIPIGCLSSNSFSENLELLDTTTRENGGWRTFRPNLQGFSVDFDGFQERTTASSTIVSYNDLKEYKRGKTLLEFKIETDKDNIIDRESFKGYIVDLSETANVGELLTFSGTITGVGVPVSLETSSNSFEYNLPVNFQIWQIE